MRGPFSTPITRLRGPFCTPINNLALAVRALHNERLLHGDINHRNVLLDRRLRPTLIDNDSAIDPAHPEAPKRVVYGEDYRPPETFDRDTAPSEAHDRYALAVLIFKLLMQGHSPFTCLQSPDEPDIAFEDMVRLGNFTHTETRCAEVPFDPPDGAPPLTCLPPAIADLFETAFDPAAHDKRPSADDWVQALTTSLSDLAPCATNPLHFHATDQQCVWCAFDQRGLRYYPSPPPPPAPQPSPPTVAQRQIQRSRSPLSCYFDGLPITRRLSFGDRVAAWIATVDRKDAAYIVATLASAPMMLVGIAVILFGGAPDRPTESHQVEQSR